MYIGGIDIHNTKKMLAEDLGHMITYHVITARFIRRRYPKGLVFGSNIKEALVLIFLSAIFKLLGVHVRPYLTDANSEALN